MASTAAESAIPPGSAAPRAELDPELEARIERGRARRGSRLVRRELWANVFPGTAFLVLAGLLVFLTDWRAPSRP